jgi:bacterioferritin-associated ferredoxin
LKSKLDKKLNKLNKDYCIIEKDDLIEKIKRCNIELSEAIKCGSCCFCSFAARQVVRAERAEKQKEQKLMAYFDEYCKLMSEEYSNFDPIKAKKELDEILAKKQ